MTWVGALLEWLRPVIVLVVLAGVADLLLPDGGLRRYVGAVLGLVVLAAVLGPVLRLLQVDLAAGIARYEAALAAARPAGLEPAPRAAVEEARRAHAQQTREAFRRLVAAEVERLALSVPGVAAARATVVLAPGAGDPPEVGQVVLQVAPGRAERGLVEPVRPVRPVGTVPADAPAPAVPPVLAAELRRRVDERLGIPGHRVRVEPLAQGGR